MNIKYGSKCPECGNKVSLMISFTTGFKDDNNKYVWRCNHCDFKEDALQCLPKSIKKQIINAMKSIDNDKATLDDFIKFKKFIGNIY